MAEYKELPQPKEPKHVYAAQHVGAGSRAHIQEVARQCDPGAEAIFIERWNLIMVRWTYFGNGPGIAHYTPVKQGQWLVYYNLSDAMGEMDNEQFHRLFERAK